MNNWKYILEQEWHYIGDSSTLYMHPGNGTVVETYETAAAVFMEILGVTLGQEWHDIVDSSTFYMHPGGEIDTKKYESA